MDEFNEAADMENPDSEYNRLLRIAEWAKANGLLGPDGEPIKPRWVTREEGTIVFRPTDDDDIVYAGDRVFIGRAAKGGGDGT